MQAKSLLIIKTGTTIAPLLKQGVDFEDWFIASSGRGADEFVVKSVFLGEPLPDLRETAGIIVTGSPAYVTDRTDWNDITAAYLREAHEREVPVLGVCYGHQLLAWAFGGDVGFHPHGREIGTVPIELSSAAGYDALLGQLPKRFHAQVSHQQSVLRLPDAAELLAANDFEPHHAFRIGSFTWGIQFHPEFSAEITAAYITERSADLEAEGINPEELLAQVSSSPEAATLVGRFCSLCGK
jgi:GMP synthase (glutamine-hydrolysing)